MLGEGHFFAEGEFEDGVLVRGVAVGKYMGMEDVDLEFEDRVGRDRRDAG